MNLTVRLIVLGLGAFAACDAQTVGLLAEAISFYHSATLSVTPAEKAGPSPTNADEDAAWLKRYLAAGGPRFSGDSYGMEIRVLAPGVRKIHSNEWSRMPGTVSPWIKTFGILPQP